MTPSETFMTMEAIGKQKDRERRDLLSIAWHIAAFSRAKKLPDLKTIIKPQKARRLSDTEKAKRQAEFEELKERMNATR